MKYEKLNYPKTEKIRIIDTLHNIEIIDNYQWLENADDIKVKEWTEAQEKLTRSIIDKLPQRNWLIERYNQLWRYDDEGIPREVLDGKRIFFYTKKKEDEHWVYYTKENENTEPIELINPNKWGATETLNLTMSSRDGKYLAFGKAKGGDENSIIRIMEVSTKKILSDTLLGWKQGGISWLPNNSGFFYAAKPLKGEVLEGEEYYWDSVYFHKLGTSASEDKKVFYDDEIKEYWHNAFVSEDGKYVLFYRNSFNTNEIYFKKIEDIYNDTSPIPIVTGFDAKYDINVIEDRLFIKTNLDASKGKVYITDIDKPERENWKEFIPESNDKLLSITAIAGNIYAIYLHNAYTLIKIYSLDGEYIRDLPLPTIGDSWLAGYWSKLDIWVNFSSFTYPYTTFKYNFDKNELKVYHKSPIEVDVSNYISEQIWYKSKDGTSISMFLIHHKDLKKDTNNPIILTAYGGFNVSMTPYFSNLYVAWLEAGGMIAMPNLRGGGEYGKEWHEAGMKEKKQNVFDDFITAAEWLIENKYTNPSKLAIEGGSNGGLLVGAATIQRPELFKAVVCAVPLLDMIRYHKFGLANIWAEEYGNAEDSEQFKYLYKYSPYHNIIDGTKYPMMLFIGGENDARVDPLHARKMVARMQEANPDGEPILLFIRKASGHGGGTTLSIQIEQYADVWAFLMDNLDMKAP